MRSDARGFFTLGISLIIAVVLGMLIAHLRDTTTQRPQPVNVPLADAR
jgi:hypothetical protein